MSVIRNELLLAGDDAYNIQRSLRFRRSASANLSRTPASAGNRKTYTWSGWVKRGSLGSGQVLLSAENGTGNYTVYQFNSSDQLEAHNSVSGVGGSNFATTAVFRDPSAWYHIVLQVDTTQATAANRVRLYVNNVLQTWGTTGSTAWDLNRDTWVDNTNIHYQGQNPIFGGNFFDGYLAEVNFIDGQALTPSSFGQNNAQTGVWQPKKYTGTYGTNGFYLPFTNNSTTTTLGNDFSGNGNNWTTNNISLSSGATYDSMTDVPTLTSATQANYSVMNPLDEGASGSTISNGNLTVATASTGFRYMGNTIWPTSGKFYAEFTLTATSGFAQVGIATTTTNSNKILGQDSTSWSYNSWNGTSSNNNSASTFGNSWTTNDVIGIALDKDTNKLYFSKNGTWQNSADPAAGTGSISISSIAGIPTLIGVCDNDNGGSATFQANFGQRPFAYTPPTGFVALNTFNLPTPTIGATASTQANKYFDISLYTGNSGSQTVTNSGSMQPDLVWIKSRNVGGNNHNLWDSVRGAGKALISNLTDSEYTANNMTGFVSNGFTFSGVALDSNTTGNNLVAWQWNAGGSTVTNTSGSISSQVRANQSAGFSIVTYTSNNTGGATVGHGLGVRPSMIILKRRSAVSDWDTYHISLGATRGIALNTTAAAVTNSNYWNNTEPTSTVFTLGAGVNPASTTMVAYCFSEVAGYSRFTSYTGNGSSDGTFCHLGFRPRFVMIKNSSATGAWIMYDTARDTSNVVDLILEAQSSSAEGSGSPFADIDFLSNGFKIRGTSSAINTSGNTYVVAAFAENPFKYSLGR